MKRVLVLLCFIMLGACDPAHIVKFDAMPHVEVAKTPTEILAPIEQRFELARNGSDTDFTIGRSWHTVEDGHPSMIWIKCHRSGDRWQFTMVEWLAWHQTEFGAQLQSAVWDELRTSGYEVALRK